MTNILDKKEILGTEDTRLDINDEQIEDEWSNDDEYVCHCYDSYVWDEELEEYVYPRYDDED